jgi:hypothetical protein
MRCSANAEILPGVMKRCQRTSGHDGLHRFVSAIDTEGKRVTSEWDDESRGGTLYTYSTDSYEYLPDIISFREFDYSVAVYVNQELTILQPQLEKLGYTEIIWLPGEEDSFGPLSRVCRAFDEDGNLHWFYYG